MNQDARSTCRAIVIIITPFVFFKMSLTCRDNFVFVKNVMTFKTCPLVRIGPLANIELKRNNDSGSCYSQNFKFSITLVFRLFAFFFDLFLLFA